MKKEVIYNMGLEGLAIFLGIGTYEVISDNLYAGIVLGVVCLGVLGFKYLLRT